MGDGLLFYGVLLLLPPSLLLLLLLGARRDADQTSNCQHSVQAVIGSDRKTGNILRWMADYSLQGKVRVKPVDMVGWNRT